MKKYPERPSKYDFNKVTRDVCECGHVETVHNSLLSHHNTQCIHCLCPTFKKEKTMTIQQLMDCNWEVR